MQRLIKGIDIQLGIQSIVNHWRQAVTDGIANHSQSPGIRTEADQHPNASLICVSKEL
jgi:hypothetical protein